MHTRSSIWIGTAGWSIPRTSAPELPGPGTHLQRYARALTGVEINSSFYRPHRPSTYAKWAAAVGEGFRFAVKVPREITHVRRLGAVGAVEAALDGFLAEAGALGEKLGPLLVQLPPSLEFAPAVAGRFFAALRERTAGEVVCEPRHASWWTDPAQALLAGCRVAQVAADPALSPAAARPGGWDGLVYYRLHGSPTIYRSAYPPGYLDSLARTLTRHAEVGTRVWCIFDNTAEGAAAANALELSVRVAAAQSVAAQGAEGRGERVQAARGP